MPIPSQPTTAISLGPTSGPSSRSISQEFSPVAPGTGIPLGAYRRGDRVADHPVNSTLPAPGQSISFSQFNGKSVVLKYELNGQNINAYQYASSPQRTGPTSRSQGYINEARYAVPIPEDVSVEFRVPAPSVVGSATRTQDAFVTGLGPLWGPLTQFLIVNQGHIVGAGGGGGSGGSSTIPYSGQEGQGGGNAIIAQRAIFIRNQNTIGGGGGGGGGAGTSILVEPEGPITLINGGGGGGGGAGQTGGAGGTGTTPSYTSPTPGTAGSLQSGGIGGSPDYGTSGGSGANLGGGPTTLPGQSGQPNGFPPSPVGGVGGAGGAPGFYAKGNSNITWLVNGTRLGQVQPTV